MEKKIEKVEQVKQVETKIEITAAQKEFLDKMIIQEQEKEIAEKASSVDFNKEMYGFMKDMKKELESIKTSPFVGKKKTSEELVKKSETNQLNDFFAEKTDKEIW